jgi:diphosphomevalonate decarboxylase
MREQDFFLERYSKEPIKGGVTWSSPSNIALIKYWGKLRNQIPTNPSISFTLDACRTNTTLEFEPKTTDSKFSFEVYLDGEKKESFKPKIETFFERILDYAPYLEDYQFVIRTENTFPHSSGIASSASGMSALALCLMSIEKQIRLTDVTSSVIEKSHFINKASFLARLGSGSACRSIEGGLVVWGEHEGVKGSSNLYGVQNIDKVHENFMNFQDTILLVDIGEKQVSSTIGHGLMNNHPFAKSRFKQANENLGKLLSVLEFGDLENFIGIVESEALTLHSMMMTSNPYFILMKPNTLKIIDEIWRFRKDSGLHPCFTLDAGANVHLLYPEFEKGEIRKFISEQLAQYCHDERFIHDQVGSGAFLLK